jgi:hypothetical protein
VLEDEIDVALQVPFEIVKREARHVIAETHECGVERVRRQLRQRQAEFELGEATGGGDGRQNDALRQRRARYVIQHACGHAREQRRLLGRA